MAVGVKAGALLYFFRFIMISMVEEQLAESPARARDRATSQNEHREFYRILLKIISLPSNKFQILLTRQPTAGGEGGKRGVHSKPSAWRGQEIYIALTSKVKGQSGLTILGGGPATSYA